VISLFRTRTLPPTITMELQGGLRVLLRPVTEADAPRFERGYVHLSETSRRQRFFGQSSALSRIQVQFLTQIDHIGHVAWVALDIDRPDDPGAGVGRYVRPEADADEAEVALTVIDAYQHRGLGMALHGCLHLTAARHGLRRFVYDVSEDNVRFLGHLKALGARIIRIDEHIVRLEMKVYSSGNRVPTRSDAGRRFAAIMTQLERRSAAAGA